MLTKDFDNSLCFECGHSPVVYASVNNGIFLCAYCGEQHKKLGTSLSLILDVNDMNKWNESYIKILQITGNKRLADLMNYYSIPKSTSRQVLYSSKLIGYYRALVRKLKILFILG
jgi:hypothetical protein